MIVNRDVRFSFLIHSHRALNNCRVFSGIELFDRFNNDEIYMECKASIDKLIRKEKCYSLRGELTFYIRFILILCGFESIFSFIE